MTVLLNRNYVRPALNNLIRNVANSVQGTDIKIHYLDANFPFFNYFPLLPHLSHHDGKKIDFSLIYETSSGQISPLQKSNSGYGIFESAYSNEFNQNEFCKGKGYFQYDFTKHLTFGRINEALVFSEKGTSILIKSILEQTPLKKIFIEPHLKTRLNLQHPKVRFHGCKAVRHDDHIHISIH